MWESLPFSSEETFVIHNPGLVPEAWALIAPGLRAYVLNALFRPGSRVVNPCPSAVCSCISLSFIAS